MSIAQSTSVPTAINVPLVTPNIVALETTVLFVAASATSPVSVWTDSVPFATTWDMLSQTVPFLKTPAAVSSLTTEIQKDCNLVPVVQVFKGGIVTVQGPNLVFSIIHLSPLVSNSPFMFTISTMFLSDGYQYTVW